MANPNTPMVGTRDHTEVMWGTVSAPAQMAGLNPSLNLSLILTSNYTSPIPVGGWKAAVGCYYASSIDFV